MSLTNYQQDKQGHFAAGKSLIVGNPVLAQHARAIHDLIKRTRENVIAIGRHLAEAQKRADHGQWLAWLDAEFEWSDETARRFINVFKTSCDAKFHTCVELDLPLRVLYQLTAPNAEQARQEITDRLNAGEEVTRDVVEKTIAHQKTADSGVAIESGDTARRDGPAVNANTDSDDVAYSEDVVDGTEASEAPTDERILREVWRATAFEDQAKIIRSEPVDRLAKLMSDVQRAELIQRMAIADLMALLSDAQRDKLFDRLVSQQIAQASPVAGTQSSKKLLTNLSGTLHSALSQADPADAAQCLRIIADKLRANKRSPKDVCLAWAKRSKR